MNSNEILYVILRRLSAIKLLNNRLIFFLFHCHRVPLCDNPFVTLRQQSQIQNKIGTIENVIEMLNGILNADKSDNESQKKLKTASKQENPVNSDDSSPERLKTKLIESLTKKRKGSERSKKDE